MLKLKNSNIISFTENKFHGGVHPEPNKEISSLASIQRLPFPNEILLPFFSTNKVGELVNHSGLKIGDTVKYGEIIASSSEKFGSFVHAPCDSEIIEIKHRNLGHLSNLRSPSIKLRRMENAISLNKSDNKKVVFKPIKEWENYSSEFLLDRIQNAGIAGLGGAIFPTHVKLESALCDTTDKIDKEKTLIVNAMECEPFITCDDKLMQEYAEEILQGALIAAKIINAKKILVGIEDNKLDAIHSLEEAIVNCDTSFRIQIIVAPTIYPSGGEKQIIELLTGLQVPSEKYPFSLNITVQNVATLFAIQQAVVCGIPLTQRLVTVTGKNVRNPGNYWLPFGTSIKYIIDSLEIPQFAQVIFGGPMMGQVINSIDVPTSKSTNCILFNDVTSETETSSQTHAPCIRCGKCEEVCPASLLPQQLYWGSNSEQWQELENQALFDCIECGACSYVCPSAIPLVDYYRFSKSQIRLNKLKKDHSDRAKVRFENREARLKRIKAAREEKRQKAAEARKLAAANQPKDPEGKQSAIKNALARVKNKNQLPSTENTGNSKKELD